ncbi:MAG TPA: hypothetical protein VKS25_08830 [Solirubrobacteraceae bacterium]|nr:hypothetical protein [Solirubrobacteraceae bacterium]
MVSLVVCEGIAAYVVHDQSWSWELDLLIFVGAGILAVVVAFYQAVVEMGRQEDAVLKADATRDVASRGLIESRRAGRSTHRILADVDRLSAEQWAVIYRQLRARSKSRASRAVRVAALLPVPLVSFAGTLRDSHLVVLAVLAGCISIGLVIVLMRIVWHESSIQLVVGWIDAVDEPDVTGWRMRLGHWLGVTPVVVRFADPQWFKLSASGDLTPVSVAGPSLQWAHASSDVARSLAPGTPCGLLLNAQRLAVTTITSVMLEGVSARAPG